MISGYNQNLKTTDTVIDELKHHVRTIMNNIAVSAMIINDTIIHSQLENLTRVNNLMQENVKKAKTNDASLTDEIKISQYYQTIANNIDSEHQQVLKNVNDQLSGINRIKDILDRLPTSSVKSTSKEDGLSQLV